MKPNNPFEMLSSASSLSVAAEGTINVPNTYTSYTTPNAPFKHGVDYYMAYAQPNMMAVNMIIQNDAYQSVDEDVMKKRIKSDICRQLAEELVASKVTFTSQENYNDATKTIRAKTYAFTHDELVNFVKNILN